MGEFPLGEIAKLIFQIYPYTFVHFLFWLVMFLVFSQYRKMIRRERELFGMAKNSPGKQTLISTFFGIGAGIIASFLLVSLGINLLHVGILYVWPFVILMMLINPRFMCFAYGGGIVSLLSLIFSSLSEVWPVLKETIFISGIMEVDVPGLISLIAILHFTEALLILFSGSIDPSPLYLRHESRGIVGGFSLQKFWPLPIVGLIAIAPENMDGVGEATIAMPDWWPIVGPEVDPPPGKEMIYTMFPLVAGLGYGDISVSSTPKEKSLQSGRYLVFYSLILLCVSVTAVFYVPFAWIAAVLSPVGHELLIIRGRKDEFSRDPIYQGTGHGVKVLDVFSGGVAANIGLKAGDTILQVNGYNVTSEEEFTTLVYSSQPYLQMDVKDMNGNRKQLKTPLFAGKEKMGLILAPQPGGKKGRYVEINEKGKVFGFFNRLKNLFRKKP